jgi:hypothetical protein
VADTRQGAEKWAHALDFRGGQHREGARCSAALTFIVTGGVGDWGVWLEMAPRGGKRRGWGPARPAGGAWPAAARS